MSAFRALLLALLGMAAAMPVDPSASETLVFKRWEELFSALPAPSPAVITDPSFADLAPDDFMEFNDYVIDQKANGRVVEVLLDQLGKEYDHMVADHCQQIISNEVGVAIHPTWSKNDGTRIVKKMCRVHIKTVKQEQANGGGTKGAEDAAHYAAANAAIKASATVAPTAAPTAAPTTAAKSLPCASFEQSGTMTSPMARTASPCDGTRKTKNDDKPMSRTATPHEGDAADQSLYSALSTLTPAFPKEDTEPQPVDI